MSKKQIANLVIIFILCLIFPLLWIFNQKLNYRSLFETNGHLLLKASKDEPEKLYSVHQLIGDFRKAGIEVLLSPKIITKSEFIVIGRVLNTQLGNVEVYEYETPKQSRKQASDPYVGIRGLRRFAYRNLLIVTEIKDLEINNFLAKLSNAQIN